MSDFVVKEFGTLEPGDVILGPAGEEVTVKAAYDAHIPERMYKIELDNGVTIEASGNHLWYIEPDGDKWNHGARLKKAKRLLNSNNLWLEEALDVATSDEPFEIGLEDLINFFDFIEDYNERYYLLLRIAESIGHIVEEEISYQDYFTGEEMGPAMEKVYDAKRFFQQALALTGNKKYTKLWSVIVGRVVSTDAIFNLYPNVDIPQPKTVK